MTKSPTYKYLIFDISMFRGIFDYMYKCKRCLRLGCLMFFSDKYNGLKRTQEWWLSCWWWKINKYCKCHLKAHYKKVCYYVIPCYSLEMKAGTVIFAVKHLCCGAEVWVVLNQCCRLQAFHINSGNSLYVIGNLFISSSGNAFNKISSVSTICKLLVSGTS